MNTKEQEYKNQIQVLQSQLSQANISIKEMETKLSNMNHQLQTSMAKVKQLETEKQHVKTENFKDYNYCM